MLFLSQKPILLAAFHLKAFLAFPAVIATCILSCFLPAIIRGLASFR